MLTLANRRLIGPPLNRAMPNKTQRADSGPGKEASSMESFHATIPRSIRAPATAASWAELATSVST